VSNRAPSVKTLPEPVSFGFDEQFRGDEQSAELPVLRPALQVPGAEDWCDVTPAATDCRLQPRGHDEPVRHTRRVSFEHGSRIVVLSQDEAEALVKLGEWSLSGVDSPTIRSALDKIRAGHRS